MHRLILASVALCGALAGCMTGEDRGAPRDTVEVSLVPPDSVRRAREDSLQRIARDSAARAESDSVLRATPGYVVDSALAPAEALRRFRAGSDSIAEFAGAPPSRDSLVALMSDAVNARDFAALDRLTVNRAEYAWIVYPHLPLSKPPYSQPPAVAWMLLRKESQTAAGRLIDRLSPEPLRVRSYQCDANDRFGALESWNACAVSRQLPDGRLVTQRLFGAIVGYRGRYRFLSLGGDF